MDNQRQTAAEVLALAICELFPDAQCLSAHLTGISFAYDFEIKQPLDQHLLHLIEEKMREIGKRNIPIVPIEMVPQNAKTLFQHHRQFCLAAQTESESAPTLSLVRIGQFYDRYLPGIGKSTGEMGAVHLTHFEKNGSFTRIHGFAFPEKKELTAFIKHFEKAKKYDHTLLGESLKLFLLSDEKVTWLPKGAALRRRLIQWWEEEQIKQNFSFSFTLSNTALVQEELIAKEYGNKFCEITHQHPLTSSHPFFRGLLTPPTETADLATLFCPPNEMIKELTSSLHFIEKTLNIFGFDPHWFLLTTGRRKADQKALLQKGLQECGFLFESEEHEKQNPAVVARIKDAYGQFWPVSWVEVETKKSLIRRSFFGSIEKMIALIIENRQGRLPLWLAPEQVRIIVISERNVSYATQFAGELAKLGYHSQLELSGGGMGQKIKAAIEERIPCITVIGDKEERSNSITIREEDNREINMTTRSFIEEMAKKIKGRT
jgi:threonyl-tRNA synthetase